LYTEGHNFGKYFLDNAVPNWRENYGHLIHPCPYKVRKLPQFCSVNDEKYPSRAPSRSIEQ
jgi:hypothetical protein